MRSAGGAAEQDVESLTTCGHLGPSSSSSFSPPALTASFLLFFLSLENGESACINAASAPFCPTAATAAASAAPVPSFSLHQFITSAEGCYVFISVCSPVCLSVTEKVVNGF